MSCRVVRIGNGHWRVEAYYPSGKLYAVLEVRGSRRLARERRAWAEKKARDDITGQKVAAHMFFRVAGQEAARARRGLSKVNLAGETLRG